LKTVCDSAELPQRQVVAETPAERVAFCVALLGRESPDLAALVEAWADLPDAIRAGIVAMVKTASRLDGQ